MKYMHIIRSIEICSQHLLKKVKIVTMKTFFKNNLNDLKYTWKRIKLNLNDQTHFLKMMIQ